jgi:cobalt-precorrin-5B (C1)-methyltransferase
MTEPKLKEGYTTGACAAAAACAATIALRDQSLLSEVMITLPCGKDAIFQVTRCDFNRHKATCSVIKDAGDDPDCTHGAEIIAEVEFTAIPAITIEGGAGIATVTRPGLGLPVGSHAINPVPRKNITEMVRRELASANHQGAVVRLSVPHGEKMAEETINARLGLIGGISILGTTGIVKPFSLAAYKHSIHAAMKVAREGGLTEICLTTGGRTEAYSMKILPHLSEMSFIQIGDHLGSSLNFAVRLGFSRVILSTMIGKLTKIAMGHMDTHVSSSAVEVMLLADLARRHHVPSAKITRITEAVTARALFEILDAADIQKIGIDLCELARQHCLNQVGGKLQVRCLLVDFEGNLIHDTEAPQADCS